MSHALRAVVVLVMTTAAGVAGAVDLQPGDILFTNSSASSRSLIRVDSDSGDRIEVSSNNVGAGPAFVSPIDVHIDSSGVLLALDGAGDALYRVDPDTGDRAVLSSSTVGAGPELADPRSLYAQPDGDYFVQLLGPTVIRIDPMSGDRSIASSPAIGNGPVMLKPIGIHGLPGGALAVVDAFMPAIFRIDVDTGDRSILSGCAVLGCAEGEQVGDGPIFTLPSDIGIELDGFLVVIENANGAGRLTRVDPTNGDRAIISGCSEPIVSGCAPGTEIGSGPSFDKPRGLAVDDDGTILVVSGTDSASPSMLRVDPVTGDRAIVTGGGVGSGPGPEPTFGVFVVPSIAAVPAQLPSGSALMITAMIVFGAWMARRLRTRTIAKSPLTPPYKLRTQSYAEVNQVRLR